MAFMTTMETYKLHRAEEERKEKEKREEDGGGLGRRSELVSDLLLTEVKVPGALRRMILVVHQSP